MKTFIVSFLSVCIAGTLVSALCPKKRMEKPLLFTCAAVVLLCILSLFTAFTNESEKPELPEFRSITDYTAYFNERTAEVLREETVKLIYETAAEYTDVPVSVSVELSYGEYGVVLEAVTVSTDEECVGLAEYLKGKTGCAVIKYKGCE